MEPQVPGEEMRSCAVPVSYRLDDHVIESRSTHRDLGVTLCHDLSWDYHYLSWDYHYDVISAKAYRCLGLLRRTFCSANCISTKKEFYLTLVRSKVMYCSQLWRPHKLKDVRKLEAIQLRATKFILGYPCKDYKSRLMELHLLPLMMELELQDIHVFRQIFFMTVPVLNQVSHLELCIIHVFLN